MLSEAAFACMHACMHANTHTHVSKGEIHVAMWVLDEKVDLQASMTTCGDSLVGTALV